MFALDALFVCERDADRREVWFGALESLSEHGDRLLARLGEFELFA
jgi:hypothetical protein